MQYAIRNRTTGEISSLTKFEWVVRKVVNKLPVGEYVIVVLDEDEEEWIDRG